MKLNIKSRCYTLYYENKRKHGIPLTEDDKRFLIRRGKAHLRSCRNGDKNPENQIIYEESVSHLRNMLKDNRFLKELLFYHVLFGLD
jgi:hypothetical protein